jgi:hypothetical protein
MPEHHSLMSRLRGERGSLPLTLLAAIIIASLASVLVARTVAGQRSSSTDRIFTRELHVADAGVQRGLFLVSAQTGTTTAIAPGSSTTFSETIDGLRFDVTVRRESQRRWTVTSRSLPAAGTGPDRTVVAQVEERPFFFPGAFGDTIIALNGTSTSVDSYNSKNPSQSPVAACTLTADKCGWGTSAEFGTNNGSLGTNGSFDFTGNTTVRPGGAFLYDWLNNPPTSGVTATNPFGNRCSGNRCTTTYVSTVDDPLKYDTPQRMGFIDAKFASGGPCADTNPATNPRYNIPVNQVGGVYVFGARVGETTRLDGVGSGNNATATVPSYATSRGIAPGSSDATDPNFTNFYCALSLDIPDNLVLASSVTSANPVVIFVKNSVSGGNQVTVHCRNPAGDECNGFSGNTNIQSTFPRPIADWLQMYVAGVPAGSSGSASNVSFRAGAKVAGIFYAPRSSCGTPGSGGVNVYGIMICRSMDNVGNWKFHFDDALGDRGSGEFLIADWVEADN